MGALLAVLLGGLAWGCDGEGPDRPSCNLGNCFDSGVGDGDADADVDGDADGDGDGDADADPVDCTDVDDDLHVDSRCEGGDDCDDQDPAVHPGATEECNGLDDDCSGGVDEGLLVAGSDVVIDSRYTGIWHIALAGGAAGHGLLRLEQAKDNSWHLLFSDLGLDGRPTGEPIVVSDTPNYLYYDTVALATLPQGWLACWCDAEERAPGDFAGLLTLARIEGGEVVQGPVLGDPAETTDQMPAIAIGDTTVGVVWQHDLSTVRYVILDLATLAVVQEDDLATVGFLTSPRTPIAWAGGAYLVTVVDANHWFHVYSIDEAGEVVDARSEGSSFGFTAVAWDGFEGAALRTDMFTDDVTEFVSLDARGAITGIAALDALVVPALAGAPRSFAAAGGLPASAEDYCGALYFAVLDPTGVSPNVVTVDDSGGVCAADPHVIPADGGWAVAWIDDERAARVDFVTCR